MAIKSISQLDQFDNNAPTEGVPSYGFPIGGDMHWLSSSFLTEADQRCQCGEGWPNAIENVSKYSNGYWYSLFEISQPENNATATDLNSAYFSKKIPYCDLIKNIIWDVKAFLNYRNLLNDYNLSAIVDGDYTFNGNKFLNGKLYVNGHVSAINLGATYGTINQLTSNYIHVNNSINVSSLNTNYLTANNLVVSTNLSLGNIQQIKTANSEIFFNGYAYGLKDRDGIKTTVGTNNNGVGDPVMFRDGRPTALTCVNRALTAFYLCDPNNPSQPLNCGTSYLAGNWGSTTWNPEYTVVKIENGRPVACNVIDFANHALWSDLGEKYLADAKYEPGTLVKFGGEKEITIADTEVNAIVSTKAFDLNARLTNGTTIALCGRVPTKIKGKIQKFDKIMLSDTPGIACKWDGKSRVIGRALEDNFDDNIKLVECVTKFEI